MEESKTSKNKQPNKAHIMETYAEDMVGVISNDKEGLVQRIIHEQEEREMEKKNNSPYAGQNKFFLLISVLFLLLTCGLIGYYYFFYQKTLTTEIVAPFKSIILTENNVFIEVLGLNKLDIANKIAMQREVTKIKKHELEGLYFTENKKAIGWSRLNTLIKSNLLQPQTPIINENFLLGIISFETKEIPPPIKQVESGLPNTTSPDAGPIALDTYVEPEIDPLRDKKELPTRKDLFILLSVKSFADVFPTMMSWETKMLSDLRDIYGISLKTEQNYLLTKEWQDGIVQNKNARILYDKEGNTVLMYVYADNNHIIVTNTEEAVKEVMERLVASRVRK